MLAQFPENVIQIRLQDWSIAGFEGHPLVLDFASQDFNAVELKAVRWQKEQGQSSLFEQRHQGPDFFGSVHRGFVQNDRQGPVHLLKQQTQKARKHLSRGVAREFGGEQSNAAGQRPDDVESLALDCGGGMALTRRGPGVEVGRGQSKASLIDKGQGQLSSLSLGLEFCDLGLGTAKSGEISFLLSEWRVRFHTKPSRVKDFCTTQVLTSTLTLSCSFSRNCGALSASALAQSHRAWTRSSCSLRGAPLRGASTKASTPLASQVSRCAATVSRSRPCSAAKALMDVPRCGASTGCASAAALASRRLARQCGPIAGVRIQTGPGDGVYGTWCYHIRSADLIPMNLVQGT